eukprot:12117801-Alexandrium_andersonii.AAC.1
MGAVEEVLDVVGELRGGARAPRREHEVKDRAGEALREAVLGEALHGAVLGRALDGPADPASRQFAQTRRARRRG